MALQETNNGTANIQEEDGGFVFLDACGFPPRHASAKQK